MSDAFLVDINPNMQVHEFTFLLCKLNEEPIQELSNITDRQYKAYFVGIDELEFNIPYYRMESDGEKVKNEIYDIVDGDHLVLVNDTKYFIIDSITEKSNEDSGRVYKEVHAYSREYSLGQKKLVDFKADSRVLYDENNTMLDGLEKGILNYIFNHVTKGWTIGEVDVDVIINNGKGVHRALEFSNSNLLQVFQELQKTYNCIFKFDTINRKIDIHSIDKQLGQNKGMLISDHNFIKSISKDIKYDEIKTRLYVYGNDVSIQSVSQTGQSYLDNFDHYKNARDSNGNPRFMTQGLINALDNYNTKIENYNPDFEPLLLQLQSANELLETLINFDDTELINKGLVALKTELSQTQTLIDLKVEALAITQSLIIDAIGTELTALHTQIKGIQSEISNLETQKSQINTLITTKQNKINAQEVIVENIKQQISTLQSELDMSSDSNFTLAQIKELDEFIKVEFYNDSNYTENNIVELYEEGKKILNRISQPAIQFSVDVVNFLNIIEYQHAWKKFVLGDIVTLEHQEIGVSFEVRLIGYEHNIDDNKLNLKFSNKNTFDDSTIYLRDLLEGFNTTSATVDFNKGKWGQVDSVKSAMSKYIDNKLEEARQNILNAVGQRHLFDEKGLWLYKENPNGTIDDEQVRGLNNLIAFTENNWQTVGTAISGKGVVAEAVYGKLGEFAKVNAEQIEVRSETNPDYTIIDFVNDQKDELNTSLTNLGNIIDSSFSDNYITNIEANSLGLIRDRLVKEANDVIIIANSLDISTTTITPVLNQIIVEVNKYVGQLEYPISITAQDRTNLKGLVTSLEGEIVKLTQAINDVKTSNNNTVLTDYINSIKTDLENQIDGRQDTWFSDGEPKLDNHPAMDWNTVEIRDAHLGDVYYDNLSGYAYRFSKNGTEHLWIRIVDSDVIEALSLAQKALDTADGKRTVFVAQPTVPYSIGDLWKVNNVSGVDFKICIVSKDKTGIYSVDDWTNVDKSKSYIDGQVGELNTSIGALGTTISNAFSDTKITNIEAYNLKLAYLNVKKEADDVINIADGIGLTIDPRRIDCYNALYSASGLQTEINKWIDKTNYPLTITTVNRNNINTKFTTLSSKVLLLLDTIEYTRNKNLDDKLDGTIVEFRTTTDSITSRVESVETTITGVTPHSILLENENQSIVTDYNGKTTSIINVMSNIDTFKGIDRIASTIGTIALKNSQGQPIAIGSFAKTNPTLTTSGNITWTIPSNTVFTTDSGWIEIPILIETKPYTKKLTWNIAKQGKDGIIGADGQDGADGTSQYFHIRYSQVADGTNFVTSPVNAIYMGTAVTITNIAPTTKGQYTWVLIKGTDGTNGIPGQSGTDGQTSYLHIKYSNDGLNFTLNDGETVGSWLGTYVDFTQADSLVFTDYKWKRISGTDGIDAYTPILSNESHTIACTSDGIPLTGEIGSTGRANSSIIVYRGVNTLTGVNVIPTTGQFRYVIGTPVGCTVVRKDNQTFYINSLTAETGSVPITIYLENGTTSIIKTFTWSKSKAGVKGTDGTNGEDGQDGINPSYVVVTGDMIFTYPKGSSTPTPLNITLTATTYNTTTPSYQWQYNDSGVWKNFTYSTNNTYVVTHDGMGWGTNRSLRIRCLVNGSFFDELTIAKVYDGADGTNGVDGTNGTDGTNGISGIDGIDGKTSYLHIKYSDNGTTFTANSGETLGKWIGTYVDFTLADSTTFSAYSWNKIVGEDGYVGSDAYTVILSNEAQSFPANSSGSIESTITTTTQVIAYKGTNSIGVTVGTLPTVTGLTLTKASNIVTIKANTGNALAVNGSFNIPITIDGKAFTKTFTWTKVNAGIDGTGANAKIVDITGGQVFKYNKGQTIPSPTSITYVATPQNTETSNFTWAYSIDGGKTFTPLTGEVLSTYTLTYNNAIWSSYENVVLKVLVDGVQDTITAYRVRDGNDGLTPVKGTDYFDGEDGQDGKSSYVWVRYSQNANGSGMVTSPLNAKYVGIATTITNTAPTSYTSYSWSLIKGTDGVDGETGADGQTSYLHIKYSDDGINFTATSGETVGKWIGTYVDFIQADSMTFNKYTWNKVVGDNGKDGIPGVKGADGQTQYFHIKYSNNGTTFTANDGEVVGDWMGTYVDFQQTDSTNFSDYTWKKIVGSNGIDSYSVILTNETHTVACDYTGIPLSGELGSTGRAISNILVYRGSTLLTPVNTTPTTGQFRYVLGTGIGCTPLRLDNDTFYINNVGADVGSVPITIYLENGTRTITKNFTWNKTKGGKDGTDGDDGVDGQNPSYVTVAGEMVFAYPKGAVTPTKTSLVLSVQTFNITSPTYQWQYHNGTGWVNSTSSTSSTFTITHNGIGWDSNKSLRIRCLVNSTYYDEITIVKIYDGADGTNGIPGESGVDGKTSYLHIKYSDNGTSFTANNGETLGKWIGTYVDFTLADSNIFSAYTWKKYVGEDGSDGSNGSDARIVNIISSHSYFVTESNLNPIPAVSFSPSVLTLTPKFENCDYSKWEHSLDGSSWTTTTTHGGLSINSTTKVLSIPNTCSLYSNTQTYLAFKVTSTTGEFDIITISRMFNPVKLADRVTVAESKITSDAIINTVSSTFATKTEFNNLEIGGRNLMCDTAFTHEGKGAWANLPTIVNTGDIYPYVVQGYAWNIKYIIPSLPKGTYTFSVKAKSDVVGVHGSIRKSGWGGNHTLGWTTDEWQTFSITFTTNVDEDNSGSYFLANSGSGSIRWTQFKLEKGNKATDWTPAPEDTQTDIDGLTTRMSTAESKITDTAIVNLVKSQATIGTGALATQSSVSTVKQTADAVTLSFNNLKSLATGQSISGGVTTINKTGVKVTHGSSTQYSEMRADGFFRNWGNGAEGAYLNDIHIFSSEASTNYLETEPPAVRVTLPSSFSGRGNSTKIVLATNSFSIHPTSLDRNGRLQIVETPIRLRLYEYARNFNVSSPYIDIKAFTEFDEYWEGDDWARIHGYRKAGFILIAIGA